MSEAKSITMQVALAHPLGEVSPEESCLLDSLDITRLPRHIAVRVYGIDHAHSDMLTGRDRHLHRFRRDFERGRSRR